MERQPIRHPLLFGEYELTIDVKNRLPVPAAVRKMFDPERDGIGFFVVLGMNRKPWLYPIRYYAELLQRDPAERTPGEDALAYDQLSFAFAQPVEWDGQGRILLQDKMLRRTGTQREVTLIGARDHLEIWNQPEWETYRESLMSRYGEIALRAKQAVRAGSSG